MPSLRTNSLTHYKSFSDVQEIIENMFVDESYRQFIKKKVHQNAVEKMPKQSVVFLNSLVQQLVKKQCMRPSSRIYQIQQQCPNGDSQVLKVKTLNTNTYRNSSINFGNNQSNNKRKSSRFKNLISLASNIQTQADQQMENTARNLKNTHRSSYFSQCPVNNTVNINKRSNHHSRKSTQFNVFTEQKQKCTDKINTILPLIQNDVTMNNNNNDNKIIRYNTYANHELDHQIQSLRNRKMKLQAAFSCFNQSKGVEGNKQYQQISWIDRNKSMMNSKRASQQHNLKSIITDYDGEMISKLPMQKIRKINSNKNKQNMCSNMRAVPIIRVKTQVATNYLQLPSNNKSFKIPNKYFQQQQSHNLNQPNSKKYQKFSFDNSQCTSQFVIQRKSNPSILNIAQGNLKIDRPIQRKRTHKKSIQQSLFNIEQFTKSRRMIEKQAKSRKNIIMLKTNNS